MTLSKNTVINVMGTVVPLVLTLGTVPFYLRLIGDVRFGILAIVWLLLSYFGLFDMGLGRATSKFMAGLHGAEPSDRESFFWTVIAINVSFGLLGGAILWAAGAPLFLHYFNIPLGMEAEVISSLPWIAAAVPVATGVSVLMGALEGREQFLHSNALQVFGAAIFQLGPLVIAYIWGPSLRLLIPAAVLSRVIGTIPMMWACYKQVPLRGVIRFQRRWIGELSKFSGWVTVSGILNPILTSLDRALVGAVQGAEALTYYTVAYNFAGKLTILPNSLTRTLFPRFSMVDAKEADRLGRNAVQGLAIVLTPMVLLALGLVHPFFNLWVGPRIATLSSPAAGVFLFGFWVNGFALVPFSLLQARNRPDVVAKFHAAELLPFVGCVSAGTALRGNPGCRVGMDFARRDRYPASFLGRWNLGGGTQTRRSGNSNGDLYDLCGKSPAEHINGLPCICFGLRNLHCLGLDD